MHIKVSFLHNGCTLRPEIWRTHQVVLHIKLVDIHGVTIKKIKLSKFLWLGFPWIFPSCIRGCTPGVLLPQTVPFFKGVLHLIHLYIPHEFHEISESFEGKTGRNHVKGPYRSRGNRSEMARAKNAPESIGEPFEEIKLWAKIPPRMRYCLPQIMHGGYP